MPKPPSTAASGVEPEPRPLAGAIRLEEGDFHALSEGLCGDPQYNDRRLVLRRKLLALGKLAAARVAEDGLALEPRTSLHHPHVFNGQRVRRMWTYLARAKAERRRLRGLLGPELGADLDAAYRNAYLCLALEAERVEVSLRVHADAWYDGQNLLKRVAAEGLGPLLALLNELAGFRLRLADWKGEWRCGELTTDRLEEFLRYWKPGEHALAVESVWPAPRGPAREALASEEAAAGLVASLARLVPVYRYAAWSQESDFLFGAR